MLFTLWDINLPSFVYVMWKTCEILISLSPTMQFLTWHPLFSVQSSRQLHMLTFLGRIVPVCLRNWSLTIATILQLSYHAAPTYPIFPTSPTFSASRNVHKLHNAVLLSRTTTGNGEVIRLVVIAGENHNLILLHSPLVPHGGLSNNRIDRANRGATWGMTEMYILQK